ncbi:Cro/C1-type HTH DNA-binding domain-containing protein [Bittarella massiliensis (ex Durand et al. 2017)]|uniref:Cro/C1-type HTH DNA-binding domain-containing protein n=1 Tax=Bittarella massiliensis (ex Durand et al. 2017) TaxID=1720313 RepID=A0AAQ1RVW1_9FIRM|nr:toxin-antitoxin system, antitoxin component, Xre domain protein [Clostridium sp. ATCC 29733]SHG07886.1 Cro/C1-type HTH DNA-binding domain-containing protein [Bittarella massiliensis (ex Durand et al. 2017)]
MAVNFLEKLNFMMGKSGLTKYSLSKASGIPYTTVDGWYKKKCEGPKLNTLRKLAKYFETSIDFWVDDGSAEELLDDEIHHLAEQYHQLSEENRAILRKTAETLLEGQAACR